MKIHCDASQCSCKIIAFKYPSRADATIGFVLSYQPNVIHLSQKKTLLSDNDNGDEELGDNDRKL